LADLDGQIVENIGTVDWVKQAVSYGDGEY
jgi:hypothetical protein